MGERVGGHAAKRGLDVVVAVVALLVLWPVMVAVGVLIRATSPGPALFRQARVGLHGQEFEVWKFRTMHTDTDDRIHRDYVRRLLTEQQPPTGGPAGLYKLSGDPRVTPLGAWLRRASLDELPQLVNVLRGEMSLVGPRPALPWEVDFYEPHHHERFAVKPGITGLWQVSGRSHLGMREALDLDVAYVRQQSLGLDVRILARTVLVVAGGAGAR